MMSDYAINRIKKIEEASARGRLPSALVDEAAFIGASIMSMSARGSEGARRAIRNAKTDAERVKVLRRVENAVVLYYSTKGAIETVGDAEIATGLIRRGTTISDKIARAHSIIADCGFVDIRRHTPDHTHSKEEKSHFQQLKNLIHNAVSSIKRPTVSMPLERGL